MKPFTTAATIILAILAIAHLYRLVSGLEVVVGGKVIPLWVSAFGALLAAVLALMVWRESRHA
jgi:hypothetical protein